MSRPHRSAEPASERVRLRRAPDRGAYDRATIHAILDAAAVAHVGVTTDAGPIVLPMAFGRTDDTLYLHGSAANALLRAGRGVDVCVTVTLVDGLVVARSAFHNSMNYRSVVVRGEARPVTEEPEKSEALRIITDHVVENWDSRRPATDAELRATLVVAVPLTEASAKVRSGPPIDDEADVGGPQWAGVVPLVSTWADPVPADDVSTDPPASITALHHPGVHHPGV